MQCIIAFLHSCVLKLMKTSTFSFFKLLILLAKKKKRFEESLNVAILKFLYRILLDMLRDIIEIPSSSVIGMFSI